MPSPYKEAYALQGSGLVVIRHMQHLSATTARTYAPLPEIGLAQRVYVHQGFRCGVRDAPVRVVGLSCIGQAGFYLEFLDQTLAL